MAAEMAVTAVLSVTQRSLRNTLIHYRTQAELGSDNESSTLHCLIAIRQLAHTGATVP